MQEGGARGFFFPDDCLELIFNKLREDDERFLDSISLVSKQFLSISNLVKVQLQVMDETLHLLPNLLRRFQHIESIVIRTDNHKDLDGILDQISRSGLLNLQALKFSGRNKPPKDGFMALALNTNMKNNLKILDCWGLISIQDNDLILIADLFPRLQKLRICAYNFTSTDEPAAHITDDGVVAFASRLKDIEEIEFCDIFGRYVERTVVNLKTLNACGTQIDNKTMTMIGNRCRDLQYLEIGYCKEVADKGAMKVARNCKRLRRVAIFECQNNFM